MVQDLPWSYPYRRYESPQHTVKVIRNRKPSKAILELNARQTMLLELEEELMSRKSPGYEVEIIISSGLRASFINRRRNSLVQGRRAVDMTSGDF
jgi:hypothetical protein